MKLRKKKKEVKGQFANTLNFDHIELLHYIGGGQNVAMTEKGVVIIFNDDIARSLEYYELDIPTRTVIVQKGEAPIVKRVTKKRAKKCSS